LAAVNLAAAAAAAVGAGSLAALPAAAATVSPGLEAQAAAGPAAAAPAAVPPAAAAAVAAPTAAAANPAAAAPAAAPAPAAAAPGDRSDRGSSTVSPVSCAPLEAVSGHNSPAEGQKNTPDKSSTDITMNACIQKKQKSGKKNACIKLQTLKTTGIWPHHRPFTQPGISPDPSGQSLTAASG